MTEHMRIVVTVSADGLVGAETQNVLGDRCLDYIAVLEDLVGGRVVHSEFTADHTRVAQPATDWRVNRDVDRA